MKAETKTDEMKLRFPGWFMHTHEQSCVHRQDYAHVGFCPETLETQQTGKASKHKFYQPNMLLKHTTT